MHDTPITSKISASNSLVFRIVDYEKNVMLLEVMNTVVMLLNNEEAEEPWLMCGVPDAPTPDDFFDIASDYELMDLACRAFRHSIAIGGKDGWYPCFLAGWVYGVDRD